ncbi:MULTISPECIES: hypothetical protein [Rhizobium]|uniref:hypothetical protein n=1 Tax=Rhizobium TaxID=379 RepID=UPI001FD4F879|nr:MULTISPECIES: hypothetical protein [Rhizobium]MCV9946027.1 hypothetical protein [Rhizobium sp. BT-175]MCW0019873.1 hypothetical protein [Rhizobium sp. BT-226]
MAGIDGFDPEAVTEIRSWLASVREQGLCIGAGAIPLQGALERHSGILGEFDRDPDRDERAHHLADKFYVQEVLQRDS